MYDQTLRVVDIVNGTTVDGPGFRTSIYFAGCRHFCPGCHNEQTWPMDAGHEMTIDELLAIIESNDMDVTFSGGDPLYQYENLSILARELQLRGRNVWCYTGFLYEQLVERQELKPLMENIDVLVDGPYLEARRDTSLLFRGSDNQRLIDVRWSNPDNIVLWQSDF